MADRSKEFGSTEVAMMTLRLKVIEKLLGGGVI